MDESSIFCVGGFISSDYFQCWLFCYQLPLKARLYEILFLGWTDSVKEVQKKYPVIDKIEYRTRRPTALSYRRVYKQASGRAGGLKTL